MLVRPGSEELVARVVGQSQDVACELRVVEAAGGCAELAKAHDAAAVLTVREPVPGGAYEVAICDAIAGTEQVRAVPTEPASGDALDTSAVFEAVALVVRSALLDIATEHDARERERRALEAQRMHEQAARDAARAAAAREAEAAALAREAEEQAERAEAEAAERAYARPPSWLIFAGGEIAAIGADVPAFDLAARLLFALGPLQLGAGFAYGLPASLELDANELEIARHSLALIARLPLRVGSRFTFDAGVHAGASALNRKTRASEGDVLAAPRTTHWSALFGAEVGAALRIAGRFGARIHVALDVLPGAPSYAVEDVAPNGETAARTELGSPTNVQPVAGITLFAAF